MSRSLTPVNRVGVDERAAALGRRSIKTTAKREGIKLATSMIDLTTLEGADTPGKVRHLCAKAVCPDPGRPEIPSCAAVCVYPALVGVAAGALRGTGVQVASVSTGFPAGQTSLEVKVTETREVPVVEKQARVVEEISVEKNVQQRQQTVRDTVKRTDVQVEQLPGQETRSGGMSDPSFRDDDYRDNYNTTFAHSGMTWEQVRPAYQYGDELARDQRYRGRDWSSFESDARRDWDARHPGTSSWDKIKDGVRHAYDRARAKL